MKDNQEKLIKLITDKVAIPSMTKDQETNDLNKVYDVVETFVGDIIAGI